MSTACPLPRIMYHASGGKKVKYAQYNVTPQFFQPPKQYMMARPVARKDATNLTLEIIRG